MKLSINRRQSWLGGADGSRCESYAIVIRSHKATSTHAAAEARGVAAGGVTRAADDARMEREQRTYVAVRAASTQIGQSRQRREIELLTLSVISHRTFDFSRAQSPRPAVAPKGKGAPERFRFGFNSIVARRLKITKLTANTTKSIKI